MGISFSLFPGFFRSQPVYGPGYGYHQPIYHSYSPRSYDRNSSIADAPAAIVPGLPTIGNVAPQVAQNAVIPELPVVNSAGLGNIGQNFTNFGNSGYGNAGYGNGGNGAGNGGGKKKTLKAKRSKKGTRKNYRASK